MPQAARAARGERPATVRGHAEAQPGPRRTVTITGRPDGPRHLYPVAPDTDATPSAPLAAPARSSRLIHIERRRPPRRAHERLGSQPDRLAMWALLMALLLIVVVAATSSQP